MNRHIRSRRAVAELMKVANGIADAQRALPGQIAEANATKLHGIFLRTSIQQRLPLSSWQAVAMGRLGEPKLKRNTAGQNKSIVLELNELDGEVLYLNLGSAFGGSQSHESHTSVAGATGKVGSNPGYVPGHCRHQSECGGADLADRSQDGHRLHRCLSQREVCKSQDRLIGIAVRPVARRAVWIFKSFLKMVMRSQQDQALYDPQTSPAQARHKPAAAKKTMPWL